jgi:hypothetical protein
MVFGYISVDIRKWIATGTRQFMATARNGTRLSASTDSRYSPRPHVSLAIEFASLKTGMAATGFIKTSGIMRSALS